MISLPAVGGVFDQKKEGLEPRIVYRAERGKKTKLPLMKPGDGLDKTHGAAYFHSNLNFNRSVAPRG